MIDSVKKYLRNFEKFKLLLYKYSFKRYSLFKTALSSRLQWMKASLNHFEAISTLQS